MTGPWWLYGWLDWWTWISLVEIHHTIHCLRIGTRLLTNHWQFSARLRPDRRACASQCWQVRQCYCTASRVVCGLCLQWTHALKGKASPPAHPTTLLACHPCQQQMAGPFLLLWEGPAEPDTMVRLCNTAACRELRRAGMDHLVLVGFFQRTLDHGVYLWAKALEWLSSSRKRSEIKLTHFISKLIASLALWYYVNFCYGHGF